jgi:hemoglobin
LVTFVDFLGILLVLLTIFVAVLGILATPEIGPEFSGDDTMAAAPLKKPADSPKRETVALYERIGAERVERLVATFYARVDADPVIRPLYGKTLTCAIRGLTGFMTSWLGGPPTYELHRTRLRRRHAPFALDARARDAWLSHMKAAVQEVGIPASEARVLLAHLEFGARALVNTGDKPKRVPCPVGNARFEPQLA